MTRPSVLICDDNIAVHEGIRAFLLQESIDILSAYDGESALKIIRDWEIDLLILDIMLPDIYGTEVCERIRKTSDMPIIMLSAKGSERDRILGLELGADDYITKPFSAREVALRVKKILHRSNPALEPKVLRFHGLDLDMKTYEVRFGGKKIDMTPKEVEVMNYMVSNAGNVLSREQILQAVWGYHYMGDTRAVDSLMSRLRQKLPEEIRISSVYGVGYKLERQNEK